MGCLGVGEAARGEQLIANQGQEWMGYSHHEQKKQDLQVSQKRGKSYQGGKQRQEQRAGGWLIKNHCCYIHVPVHMHAIICYLRITLLCV